MYIEHIYTCEWGWMHGNRERERILFLEGNISDFSKFTIFLFSQKKLFYYLLNDTTEIEVSHVST